MITGAYLNVGNRIKLSAGTYTVTKPETNSAEERCVYYTYPTVFIADTANFNLNTASFSVLNGQSFASKIGNPYDAKLGLFGLPSKNVDVKSIGWSNAKFVKLTGDDKSDLRFRFYNPSNNNVGVGNSIDNYDPVKNHSGLIMYMPIQKRIRTKSPIYPNMTRLPTRS